MIFIRIAVVRADEVRIDVHGDPTDADRRLAAARLEDLAAELRARAHAAAVARLAALATEVDEAGTTEALTETVLSAAQALGSGANDSHESQVLFLLERGYTAEEIESELRNWAAEATS